MHLETLLRPADSVGARPLSGLLAGTTILTMDGQLPVETLAEGDRVITRDAGMAILKEIKAFTVTAPAYRIKAGTLGNTRPDCDTIVARDALIHIRDWRAQAIYGDDTALVPAHRLADGEYIAELNEVERVMFELIFDKQHIVYADGLEIATAAV